MNRSTVKKTTTHAFELTQTELQAAVLQWLRGLGVEIPGGRAFVFVGPCCGSTPDAIAKLTIEEQQ